MAKKTDYVNFKGIFIGELSISLNTANLEHSINISSDKKQQKPLGILPIQP